MDLRLTYLMLARRVVELIELPQVADRWAEPSALGGWTIGGLAGHLARGGVWIVEEYLDRVLPEADVPSVGAGEYFSVVPSDPGHPVSTAIVARGEEAGALGPGAVVDRTRETLARLETRLPAEPQERRLSVGGGQVMALDEYLRTRVLELIVHSDDLVVSAGLELFEPDPAALGVVLGLALDVMTTRHGGLEVMRALFRRERRGPDALQVF